MEENKDLRSETEIEKSKAEGMNDLLASGIKCPFCGDEDFDLPGLKRHLRLHCEEFDKTENV